MARLLIILFLYTLSNISPASAQRQNPLSLARHHMANGSTDSALAYYQAAYEEAPFDVKIYNEFLELLIRQQQYPQAEKLIERMSQLRPEDPGIILDKAELLLKNGKKKDHRSHIDQLIQSQYKKSSYHIHNLANAFISRQMINEAVTLYEEASRYQNNSQLYGKELMNLYLEKGEINKVIPYFAEYIPYYPNLNEDLKSKILKLIEKDPKNKQRIEKALQSEIKKKNTHLNDYLSLLNWLKQLDGSKEAALDELIAVNKKNPEAGLQDIIVLGQEAITANDFSTGSKAFTYLLSAHSGHVREIAFSQLLKNNYYQLYHQRPYDKQLVASTLNLFEDFFESYPQKKREMEYLWYTDVIAKFDQRPEIAIDMMNTLLSEPGLSKHMTGVGKLSLGDYYLFAGQMWDANLSYAQVDKLFRQDRLGEEARFKQAKLAFYRGDFKWAQNQLNVLKASTTELIANDAMQLSIMITENTFSDTISLALKKYATADLLLYQQQFEEAEKELKEILTDYPDHDLSDDVYLLLGNLSVESARFSDAVTYYQKVIDMYYDDVLADDALLRLAQVYQKHLNDNENALKYYEKLLTDFNNSSLVPAARAEYQKLTVNNKL